MILSERWANVMQMSFDHLAQTTDTLTQQYGPVVGGAVAIATGVWALVKFLFNRIEQSHQAHLAHAEAVIKREQLRAERAEERADRYEQELKESVRAWFEQVAPAMGAAARALDAVTGQLRTTNDERRHP